MFDTVLDGIRDNVIDDDVDKPALLHTIQPEYGRVIGIIIHDVVCF